ncbi:MAG: ABC transporter permease [Rhodospirillaceae bacterium]|nr:ABC transporter permease [Rhodospirillaceae bacterium]
MTRFAVTRAIEGLIVLLLMSFVVYGLIGLMPGDPIDLMIASNPKLTTADGQRLRALYGLDRPILERYLNWLTAAVQGDFGYSRAFARPVLELVGPRLVNTLVLLITALAVALIVGLGAGLYAALHPRSWIDDLIGYLSFISISTPTFWLALLLIMLFAVVLGVLPASGMPVGADTGLAERLRHLILPVATLSLASAGGYTRYMRAAMIETLGQDFIRTARSKGASEMRIVLRHGLRNALIPVITVIALDFGALFSGALITETMFAYPGMGKAIYDAIMANDFNLALVTLLFATLTTLAGNFAADLGYAWLDPRISLAAGRAGT